MRLTLHLIAGLLVAALVGCSSSGGALGRAESTGILTVGAIESAPAVVPTEGGEVTGSEAELVERYAQSIDASPTWRVGGSEDLVAGVERGEVDVVIGAPAGEVPEGMSAVGDRDGLTMLVKDDETALRDSLQSWLEDA